jgi:subtilisin family serine protease
MKRVKMMATTSMLVAIVILLLMGMWGIARVYAFRSDRTDQPLRVGLASSITAPDDKIEVLLLERFATQKSTNFIVSFSAQADLAPAYRMSWKARGEYVVESLRNTAAQSQAGAKTLLDGAGLRYQTFLAGNELYVFSGNLEIATRLAYLPEVSRITATRIYYLDPTVERPFGDVSWAGELLAGDLLYTVPASTGLESPSPEALAWGISYTQADQFWTTFGVQGDGIIVANIDTGVQWNHPALDQAYRRPVILATRAAGGTHRIFVGHFCDNQGHGTHTIGSMVGDDDPSLLYQAGMAPNAQWIACKGCESNFCTDFALNTCADWILAPGDDPANRPHVVNNSWGGGGGDAWYLSKVNAWRAAGIFPAFSAGNAGSSCNTLGSPGDYQQSFASAAHNSSGTIASFSSRGPSAFGHDPYTKPNIAAPGVAVCSSVPTNAWSCAYNGTSMASPHSAGAVALLWSCNPALIGQMDLTFQALQNSAGAPPAGNCGAPPDGEGNYTYGYGYLNALAAGLAVCDVVITPTPTATNTSTPTVTRTSTSTVTRTSTPTITRTLHQQLHVPSRHQQLPPPRAPVPHELTYPDEYPYSDRYSHAESYSDLYLDRYSNTDWNSYSHPNAYGYTHFYTHGNAYLDCNLYPD